MDSRYKQEQDDVSSLVFCCLLGEGIYRKEMKRTAQQQRHMMQVRIVSREHGMRIRSCGIIRTKGYFDTNREVEETQVIFSRALYWFRHDSPAD